MAIGRVFGYDQHMGEMKLKLPDSLKSFLEEQASSQGFDTPEAYLRDLVTKEQARQRVRDLVRQGDASPIAGKADEKYFRSLREYIREYRG